MTSDQPPSEHSNTRVRELDLIGKVALITGASRGIGAATALNLASRGCSILGTCTNATSSALITGKLNDKVTQLFQTTTTTTTTGGERTRPTSLRIEALVADIFSSDCHLRIADAIQERFDGHVDIVINNACDPMPGPLGNLTATEISHSMLGNIQTPVLIVDELVKRRLFRRDSRIVYVSSGRQRQPWSGQLMYSATKAAGESLCRTWAQAFGGKEEEFAFMAGTTANSVIVGLTQTDAVMNCGPEMVEQFKAEFMPLQSKPEFGQPEDVADVIGLLCGHDARWITGCAVSASGGGFKVL